MAIVFDRKGERRKRARTSLLSSPHRRETITTTFQKRAIGVTACFASSAVMDPGLGCATPG
jgi:hypothetical protein